MMERFSGVRRWIRAAFYVPCHFCNDFFRSSWVSGPWWFPENWWMGACLSRAGKVIHFYWRLSLCGTCTVYSLYFSTRLNAVWVRQDGAMDCFIYWRAGNGIVIISGHLHFWTCAGRKAIDETALRNTYGDILGLRKLNPNTSIIFSCVRYNTNHWSIFSFCPSTLILPGHHAVRWLLWYQE